MSEVGVSRSCGTCQWHERDHGNQNIGICILRRERIEKMQNITKDELEKMYTARWQICDEWEMVLSMRHRIAVFHHHVSKNVAQDLLTSLGNYDIILP